MAAKECTSATTSSPSSAIYNAPKSLNFPNHPIQGVIVTSLDSGILLFQQEITKGFGLRLKKQITDFSLTSASVGDSVGSALEYEAVDAYQLASSLYTVYNNSTFPADSDRNINNSITGNSSTIDGGNRCIKSVVKENQLILFDCHRSTQIGESFLVTLFAHKGVAMDYSQALLTGIVRAICEANISTLSSPRPSTVKQLRAVLGSLLASPSCIASADVDESSNLSLATHSKNFIEFYSPSYIRSEGIRSALLGSLTPYNSGSSSIDINSSSGSSNINNKEGNNTNPSNNSHSSISSEEISGSKSSNTGEATGRVVRRSVDMENENKHKMTCCEIA